MNQHIALIFFLLFVAYQVITAIINHINTKKQQERAAEMARARRERTGTAPVASTEPVARPAEATVGGAIGPRESQTRLDDVIARRKAQLEELRGRREGRVTPQPELMAGRQAPNTFGSQPELRIARPPAQKTGQATARPAGGGVFGAPVPGTAGPGGSMRSARQADVTQARQEAIRRAREAQQARQRAEQTRLTEEAERRRRDAAQTRVRQERARAERLEAEQAISQRHRLAAQIRSGLRNKPSLRQAIVLKEVLDLPLALRETPA